MDYQKHYLNLIEKANKRKIDKNGYYEKHHIIPKSIFSDSKAHEELNKKNIKTVEDPINKVKLLPEEHLIAHLLLVRIFKNNGSNCYERMLYAANFLTNRVKSNKEYKSLKKAYSKMLSKIRTGKPSGMAGKKWSKKRLKIGQVHLKGKTYEQIHGSEKAKELKRKRSQDRKNKTFEEMCGVKKAEQWKKKISERVITEEWKQKISKANKGKKRSEEYIQNIKNYMRDDKKNPNIHQQLYKFENIKTGECIVARKYDMKKNYGCNSIHRLFNGKAKKIKNWKLLGEVKSDEN